MLWTPLFSLPLHTLYNIDFSRFDPKSHSLLHVERIRYRAILEDNLELYEKVSITLREEDMNNYTDISLYQDILTNLLYNNCSNILQHEITSRFDQFRDWVAFYPTLNFLKRASYRHVECCKMLIDLLLRYPIFLEFLREKKLEEKFKRRVNRIQALEKKKTLHSLEIETLEKDKFGFLAEECGYSSLPSEILFDVVGSFLTIIELDILQMECVAWYPTYSQRILQQRPEIRTYANLLVSPQEMYPLIENDWELDVLLTDRQYPLLQLLVEKEKLTLDEIWDEIWFEDNLFDLLLYAPESLAIGMLERLRKDSQGVFEEGRYNDLDIPIDCCVDLTQRISSWNILTNEEYRHLEYGLYDRFFSDSDSE